MNARHLLPVMMGVTLLAGSAQAQTILDSNDAAKAVELRNIQFSNNVITGEVINKSPHVVRNVEILLQYHWLWKNEMRPEDDSPGRSFPVTLERDLLPGQSVSFAFKPEPPLPSRTDGQYMPEVSLAGFAVVVPQPPMAIR